MVIYCCCVCNTWFYEAQFSLPFIQSRGKIMVFLDICTLLGWTSLSSKPVEKKSKMGQSARQKDGGNFGLVFFFYYL